MLKFPKPEVKVTKVITIRFGKNSPAGKYLSPVTAAKAWAESMAYKHNKNDLFNSPAYIKRKKKWYRRSLPIFQRMFE